MITLRFLLWFVQCNRDRQPLNLIKLLFAQCNRDRQSLVVITCLPTSVLDFLEHSNKVSSFIQPRLFGVYIIVAFLYSASTAAPVGAL